MVENISASAKDEIIFSKKSDKKNPNLISVNELAPWRRCYFSQESLQSSAVKSNLAIEIKVPAGNAISSLKYIMWRKQL